MLKSFIFKKNWNHKKNKLVCILKLLQVTLIGLAARTGLTANLIILRTRTEN